MNYNEFFKRARLIYSWLEDEMSKKLFLNRLELGIGGLECRVNDANDSRRNVLNRLQDCSSENVKNNFTPGWKYLTYEEVTTVRFETVVLCGAGKRGEFLLERLANKAKRIVVCDERYGKIDEIRINEFLSCPVISKQQAIRENPNAIFLITPMDKKMQEEIHSYLVSQKVPSNDIYHYFGHYRDNEMQYFDEKIIELSQNEVFIDGGSFNGMTALSFAEKCNYKYNKIYTFEPDRECVEKVRSEIKELENVEFHELGLWDENNVLSFKAIGNGSSTIDISYEDKEEYIADYIKINVNSIDNILKGNPATFIKMDIEGSELKALKGAKYTIQKYKPKLAICIYHKDEDIFEIPEYIKSLVPNYKLYIRHYSSGTAETVLYAVMGTE